MPSVGPWKEVVMGVDQRCLPPVPPTDGFANKAPSQAKCSGAADEAAARQMTASASTRLVTAEYVCHVASFQALLCQCLTKYDPDCLQGRGDDIV